MTEHALWTFLLAPFTLFNTFKIDFCNLHLSQEGSVSTHFFFSFFFLRKGPTLLLYTYTKSHLGAARHDYSLPTLASEEFFGNCRGINCLAQGHLVGRGGERAECVSH